MNKFFEEYKYHILITTSIVFSLISPILLTKFSLWLTFNEHDSHIGDTIGGITAPFFNIIGSLLIFFTFNEQRKEKKENNNKNIAILFINHLKELIINYSFSDLHEHNPDKLSQGYDAFNNFFNEIQHTKSDKEDLDNKIEIIEVGQILKLMNSAYTIIDSLDEHSKEHFINYMGTIVSPIIKSNDFIGLSKKSCLPDEFKNNLISSYNKINNL